MEKKIDSIAGIIDNLRRVFQVINEYSKQAEKVTGLTGPQLWAIKILAETAPIMVSELARRMYLHPATVVGIVDRLESRKLVCRTRCSNDRRVVRVDLTQLGKDVVANSPEVAQGLLARGLESLSKEQVIMIADGIEQLVDMVGANNLAPKLFCAPGVNLPLPVHDEEGAGLNGTLLEQKMETEGSSRSVSTSA